MSVSRSACAVAIASVVLLVRPVNAQIEIGTWLKTSNTAAGGLTMTVEACCNGGRRLVYRVTGQSAPLMTVESPMDGTEVPVLVGGKPSGETMAIKRVDARHTVTVLKMNGKDFGTSRATLSADGKTLTVENEVTFAAGGQTPGKQTETWIRQ